MRFQSVAEKAPCGMLSPAGVAFALVRRAPAMLWAAAAGRNFPPFSAAAILFALAMLCAACASAPHAEMPPDPEHAEGRELYIKKCGACHALIAPGEFTHDAWIVNVQHFAPRAKLAVEDQPAVIAYLQAHASDAKP